MSKYTETKVGKYIVRKYIDGSEYYFLNRKSHREDGPAVIDYDGSEYWYFNEKSHRENGPAIKYSYGSESYYLNNIKYSKIEYKLIPIQYRINIVYE